MPCVRLACLLLVPLVGGCYDFGRYDSLPDLGVTTELDGAVPGDAAMASDGAVRCPPVTGAAPSIWMETHRDASGIPYRAVRGAGSDRRYAVALDYTLWLSLDAGTTWNAWLTLPLTNESHGLWAVSDRELWVAQRDMIVRLTLDAVFGSPVYKAYDPTTQYAGRRSRFEAVWASGSSEVWAVTTPFMRTVTDPWRLSGGDVMQLTSTDNTSWALSIADFGVLFGVHGTAQGDLYVVGHGIVLHRGPGASSWTIEAIDPSVSNPQLQAVFADGDGAWAVGAGGLVLQREATGVWRKRTSGTPADLYGIWGRGCELYAVGTASTVLRSLDGGETWTSDAGGVPTTPSTVDLYSVYADARGVSIVGAGRYAGRRD